MKNSKLKDLTENLDSLNQKYFEMLYHKFLNSSHQKDDSFVIFDEKMKGPIEENIAYPTAIAPNDLMKTINVYQYSEIEENYAQKANEVSLWLKKMNAGTGSSLQRVSYLKDIVKRNEKKLNIGAKATDLYIQLEELISLTEVQLLQLYYFVENTEPDSNLEVIVQDIVGPETAESLKDLWKRPSYINKTLNYEELFFKHSKLSRSGVTYQSQVPTLCENKELTLERIAPAGHALFAVEALIAAYKKELRPSFFKKNTLISAIANGEDLSARPDAKILGLIKTHALPITMITTTKTKNDLKGGQIAIIKRKDGSITTSIIEKAQAEHMGQLELFESLGLRKNDSIAFFNTNIALLNYEVLTPIIEKIIEDIGEEKFFEVISPDLILNKKSIINNQGDKKSYTQLEGAMGSSLLNLDQFYRLHYKKALVSFINVDSDKRTDFFSPIKTAFDFYMQFYSDRFHLNKKNMTLKNLRPKALPNISFSNDYYKEMKNILECFQGASILDLESINVKSGIIIFKNIILKGTIEIELPIDLKIDLEKYLRDLLKAENKNIYGVTNQENKLVINNCKLFFSNQKLEKSTPIK